MGEIIDLAKWREENQTHFVIETRDGDAHVVPWQTLADIVNGKLPLTELEDYEKIMAVIIYDWLKGWEG